MFKILLKVRIQSYFSALFQKKKSKKQLNVGQKILYALLMVYVTACFVFLFAMQFTSLLPVLMQMDMLWLYFSFAGIMAAGLSLIGSIFVAQAELYNAKDNDLLLALPIKPQSILASRITFMLLGNYGLSFLVMGTALGVYLFKYSMTAMQVVGFIITFLTMPLFVLSVSCILGALLAFVSSKMRKKTAVQLIISIAFFGLYFVLMANFDKYISMLVEKSMQIGQTIQASLFPVYHFGLANTGNVQSMLYFVLSASIPFLIIYYILSRSFIKIVTSKKGLKKVKYEQKSLNTTSPFYALVKKELRHFTSSSTYMLNAGFGVIFIAALPVLYMVNKDKMDLLLSNFALDGGTIMLVISAIICAMSGMNLISAPSVSLEGKNLWISKTLPVKAKTVLFAKAYMHSLIVLPFTLVASIAFIVLFKTNLLESAFMVFLPVIFNIMIALFGVVTNLKHPKFDYINETACVKQSMSVLITMLFGWGVIALPVLLYIFIAQKYMSPLLYAGIVSIFFVGLVYILYMYIEKKSEKMFLAL